MKDGKTLIRIYESNSYLGWDINLEGQSSRTILEVLGTLRMVSSDVEDQVRDIEDEFQ